MNTPKFISHPDFYAQKRLNVYHKELDGEGKVIPNLSVDSHPAELYNKHILYLKKEELPAFRTASLKISADDHYKLYINGKFVTEGPAPSYPENYFYNEIDVAEYLTEGENTFAVHTFYQGLINRSWVSGDLCQMLWFSLSIDGRTALVSDESWLCKYHTGYTECGTFGYRTAYAECYDAGAPEARFYDPDFSCRGFVNAKEHAEQPWQLVRQSTRQLDIYDMQPERIDVCDFGLRIAFPTEAVGNLSFRAVGKANDIILLRYGEELDPDGSVRFNMRCNCNYEEKMILSGGEDMPLFFDYKAFRYAELHFGEDVKISDIKMTVRHYPFTEAHKYDTGSDKLDSVIGLCANTIKYGTQEQFLDCPTREKGAYLGDLMVSGRAHAVLTGDTTLIKQAVKMFNDTAAVSQGLLACAGGSFMQEIADYSLEFPAILAWIYSLDGDIDFVRECEPYATGVYEYYRGYENDDGLLDCVTEWNLVDWPDNLRDGYDFPLTKPIGKGVHNVMNALWYGLKLALGEVYEIIGKSRDLGAKKTYDSFISHFYSDKTGLFVDAPGSLHSAVHSNIFPLLFGIGTEDEALKSRIVDLIRQKRLTSMGVYMAYFALAALKNAGEYELCRELGEDEGAWLNMIAEGATLTFEAWGKEQKWNTSLCHPWATAPLIIFANGIRAY